MERKRLERAQAEVERVERDAQDQIKKARSTRDREILRAVRDGASVADVARALGLTREGIYSAMRRASPE